VIYYQKEYKRLIIELDKQNKLLRKPLEWEAWVNWRDIYYFDFIGKYIAYQINDVHGEIIKYGSNYQIWGHSLDGFSITSKMMFFSKLQQKKNLDNKASKL
jgi:hypothetical protein